VRLDTYLVEHGHFESRNRALEAIKAGQITIRGKKAKASQKVDNDTEITIQDQKFYVSRAAKKLESFLTGYPLTVEDATALDIGSSTGGFAQILLEVGVKSLNCVDVGQDQLHHSLRNNARLTLHEQTDIRDFQSGQKFSLITCDVSFISILQILKDINRLSASGTDIIILYKPQFEVGRTVKRDSKGVVQDQDAVRQCMEAFENKTKVLGWKLHCQTESQVAGKEGNQEYLYHFVKIRDKL